MVMKIFRSSRRIDSLVLVAVDLQGDVNGSERVRCRVWAISVDDEDWRVTMSEK